MLRAHSSAPIRLIGLALFALSLVTLGGCAHRRPEAALNCELPAYKMLPSSLDTQRRAGPPLR